MPGAPPRGGYRGAGRAQGGQLQVGGRGGPGPRRAFDEPEDVEFVKVMKGHARQITSLAFDHSSSQVRQPVSECVLRIMECRYQTRPGLADHTMPHQHTYVCLCGLVFR